MQTLSNLEVVVVWTFVALVRETQKRGRLLEQTRFISWIAGSCATHLTDPD